ADLACRAVGQSNAREQFDTARGRVAPADAMQGCVVQQVLLQREVEIERARLEHYAQQPQRFSRLAADVVAEDADVAGLDAEQAGDQREQGAFPGTVQS